MRKRVLLLALLVLLPGWLQAQVPPVGPRPNRPDMMRRQMLQGQIVRGFMNKVARDLNLDAATRMRLEDHMRESGEKRRELARRTTQLRQQMIQAARDSATSDGQFRQMLKQMADLRHEEENLWQQDQQKLSQILTPRQQTQFTFMWLRFNEQVREMALQQRPPLGLPR